MVPKIATKALLKLKQHQPLILTCIGGAGVIITTITAITATTKASKLLSKVQEAKEEKLTKREIIRTVAPIYIPTVLIGLSTITCIFAANALNVKKQASITSAYALINQSFKKYRDKVKELYGEETDIHIRQEIAKSKFTEMDPELCVYPVNGLEDVFEEGEKVLFYDEYSNRTFEASILAVQAAEYHLNRNFVLRGTADLNEFYSFLGLPETKYGSTVGWSMAYGYSWIDFEHEKVLMDDGTLECYMIQPMFSPDADFLEC